MLKNILLFTQIILLQVQSFAQKALDKALLWEISGKELSQTSYLFGTIHMIPKDDYFLPKGFEEAFESSSTLYLELDINEMSDMSKMMGLLEKCYMRDNKKLSDLLSEEDLKIVKTKIEDMGLPFFMFERMKPLFLSSMMMTDGANPMSGPDEKIKSYEFELMEKANTGKKPLKGIETMEFQLSIFDSIPYEIQAKNLVHSIQAEENKSDDSLKGLVELYKTQDIEKLVDAVEKSDEDMKPFLDLMLTNRNKSWIPTMKEAMKNNSCFFAVGAGHLGGEYGVINLLKKEGYKLKPVK